MDIPHGRSAHVVRRHPRTINYYSAVAPLCRRGPSGHRATTLTVSIQSFENNRTIYLSTYILTPLRCSNNVRSTTHASVKRPSTKKEAIPSSPPQLALFCWNGGVSSQEHVQARTARMVFWFARQRGGRARRRESDSGIYI